VIQSVLDRLRLRVSCRPGLWPATLEGTLKNYFPVVKQEAPLKWDLMPLRERDVLSAAAEHGLEIEHFKSQLKRAGAYHFASLPLGLKLIIRILGEDTNLPATHVKMYRRGCQHLVDEHSITRREYAHTVRVSGER
jgi:hypothetical protein